MSAGGIDTSPDMGVSEMLALWSFRTLTVSVDPDSVSQPHSERQPSHLLFAFVTIAYSQKFTIHSYQKSVSQNKSIIVIMSKCRSTALHLARVRRTMHSFTTTGTPRNCLCMCACDKILYCMRSILLRARVLSLSLSLSDRYVCTHVRKCCPGVCINSNLKRQTCRTVRNTGLSFSLL